MRLRMACRAPTCALVVVAAVVAAAVIFWGGSVVWVSGWWESMDDTTAYTHRCTPKKDRTDTDSLLQDRGRNGVARSELVDEAPAVGGLHLFDCLFGDRDGLVGWCFV